jgi:hypothetical protein
MQQLGPRLLDFIHLPKKLQFQIVGKELSFLKNEFEIVSITTSVPFLFLFLF